MKSYLLVGLKSVATARDAMRASLPGQEEPWVLRSSLGDPIAYFTVQELLDGEPNVHLQADMSGRHYNEDTNVLAVLEKFRESVGGTVVGDA